jgi:hypothetical protein
MIKNILLIFITFSLVLCLTYKFGTFHKEKFTYNVSAAESNIFTHPSYEDIGGTSPGIQTPVANPVLNDLCGLDIALIIDRSTSISSTNFAYEKTAMKNFVSGFASTNTRFSLTQLSDRAEVVHSLTSNITDINNAIDSITHREDGTNWMDGINKANSTLAGSTKSKLMVMASDGTPTLPGNWDYAIKQAIIAANNVKSSGTRILAVGIGEGTSQYSQLKLQLISGLNELRPITTGSYSTDDIAHADFMYTSFTSMTGSLRDFAIATCPEAASPTPTPIVNAGWFKLKNTSFSSTGNSQRTNVIPQVVSEYDSDDTSEKQLIVGEGGLITTENAFSLYNTNIYSNNNWLSRGYKLNRFFYNTTEYINFLKQKSSEIETIANLSEIATSNKKIFFYDQNLTINDSIKSLIDKKNLILIVNGDIDFNMGNAAVFDPSHSLIFVAKNIMFYNQTTTTSSNPNWSGILSRAKGIFIADKVVLGNSTNTGIKIIGNLISLENQIINSRKQTDFSKPSFFVVFDPKIYMDTISAIGIKAVNWDKQ